MKTLWGALGAIFFTGWAIAAPPPASAPAVPSVPAGLRLDSGQPIQVNADTFLADLNQSTGTYRGNVVVVQGQIKLRADVVRVIAPDGKARRMEASGHVVVDSPSGTATGDNGIYDVIARVIHLTGRVVLTKNQNVMRGTALDVQMATGQARLVATGESGKPGRVQAVFVPPPRGAPDKPAATPAPSTAPASPAPPSSTNP